MKTSIDLTPSEIRKAVWEALVSELGVAKSLSFLLEYERGQGNYTELRKELFTGQTVDQILEDMAKEDHVASKSCTGSRSWRKQAGKQTELDSPV